MNSTISPWRSSHQSHGRFFNPRMPRRDVQSFLRWIFTRQQGPWCDFTETQSTIPSARVEDHTLRVTFVNHSTFLIQSEGYNLLTDPVWSERVSPVRFAGPRRHRSPGVSLHELPTIDVILLSHNHYDHCDYTSLRALARRDNPAIFCPLGLARSLRKLGFSRIFELDWWQSDAFESLRIHAVPAQHFSARGLFDRNRTLWCGWMVESRNGAIYFAGDTGFADFFEEIAADFPRIRLALLPIGAYAPEWLMGPIHMTPEESLAAHQILCPEQSLATHFGTFALADDGEFDPVERLHRAIEKNPPQTPFLLLREGECQSFPVRELPSEPNQTSTLPHSAYAPELAAISPAASGSKSAISLNQST